MSHNSGDSLGRHTLRRSPVRGSGILEAYEYKKCEKCGRVLPMTRISMRRKYCVGRCLPKDKKLSELTSRIHVNVSPQLRVKVATKASELNMSSSKYIITLLESD